MKLQVPPQSTVNNRYGKKISPTHRGHGCIRSNYFDSGCPLTSPRLHYNTEGREKEREEEKKAHVRWYYPPMHNQKRERNISDSHVRTEKTEKPYKNPFYLNNEKYRRIVFFIQIHEYLILFSVQ